MNNKIVFSLLFISGLLKADIPADRETEIGYATRDMLCATLLETFLLSTQAKKEFAESLQCSEAPLFKEILEMSQQREKFAAIIQDKTSDAPDRSFLIHQSYEQTHEYRKLQQRVAEINTSIANNFLTIQKKYNLTDQEMESLIDQCIRDIISYLSHAEKESLNN